MIDDIIKNIQSEQEILKEIDIHSERLPLLVDQNDAQLLQKALISLTNSLRIVNNSIPQLLQNIENPEQKNPQLKDATYQETGPKVQAKLSGNNRAALLKELSIGGQYLKKLKQASNAKPKIAPQGYKRPNKFLRFSNKLFGKKAAEIIRKKKFISLAKELKRANIDILLQTYISMMLTTTLFAVIAGIFLTLFFTFFTFTTDRIPLAFFEGNQLIRLFKVSWLLFATPALTFALTYYYPTSERKGLTKKINKELPFAVIHMSAISGSGIQPSEIFRIIGLSKEYPSLRKEVRKIVNQMNLYGYDLVTALTNISTRTPSLKLSELLSGLATTITSGGNFSEFFDKRAESLLVSYRLEREKFSKTAETFMDVYISVVIAAPMILMLFLILLSVGNFDIGLSIPQLTALIIGFTALINLAFLTFIHLNQPAY